MKLRLCTYLLLLSGLVGCSNELEANVEAETGSVTLNISAATVSKATSSDVLNADDDRLIKTLTVWLVQNGTVADVKTSTPDATSEIVTFNNVLRGDYKLYVVANYGNGLATTYPKGSSSLTGLQDYILGDVTDGTSPAYTSTNGIPSSLMMDISVAPGNNEIAVHLKRVVGRLSIAFRNMTEHDLYVGEMTISDYNPSQGYLFSRDHSIPGTAAYLRFPSLSGNLVKIGNETIVFDHYLYETGNHASPFKLAFDAGLYTDGASPTYTETSVEYININVGANKDAVKAKDLFMIRSYNSPTFYVGADDSGLICTEFNSDNNINNSIVADNYIWEWLDDASLRNIATGKYLAADYANLKPCMSDNPSRIYIYNYGGRFSIDVSNQASYIYMKLNASNTGVDGSSNTPYNWYLRSVSRDITNGTKMAFTGDLTSFLARIEKSHTYEMIYLDSYGIAQPLTHICRNEHIKLTVNVSYQQSTGGFDINVSGWAVKSNETTFD
jgi:hypothetical protein